MLRIARIILAVTVFAAIFLLFIDFTGTAAAPAKFLPHYQVIPAILALNITALAILCILTLLFGRIYCSVLCPLGVYQDIVSALRRITSSKRKRRAGLFRPAAAHTKTRIAFLGLFVVLAGAALLSLIPMSIAGLLDPYSIFGRAMGQLVVPAAHMAGNSVVDAAADNGVMLADRYAAPSSFTWLVAAVAAVQMTVVTVMALRTGRTYCNSVCPVGTVLGLLLRFSLFKPVINLDRCNSCGSCGRRCKAKCINTKAHSIDYSRCVSCMDCIENCTQGAISYGIRRRKPAELQDTPATAAPKVSAAPDKGRRSFITGLSLAVGAGTALAADKAVDGGLAPLKAKQPRKNITPSVPAGAISIKHLRSHCTACQLCVSACPSGVLKPSLSADGFMQPVMVFTDGFCRPECVRCSELCPAGAIKPVEPAQKVSIKTGTAVVDTSLCISAAFGQTCGNCVQHCPAGALKMIKDSASGNLRPVVDTESCIGCGSCEYHCPSGTAGMLSAKHAAIYIEGIELHRTI